MRLRKLLQGALLALALCSAGGLAQAQEVDPHEGPKKSWLELFKTTGMVGYLMLGCSVIGTTLVIEHIVSLRREKYGTVVHDLAAWTGAEAETVGPLERLTTPFVTLGTPELAGVDLTRSGRAHHQAGR